MFVAYYDRKIFQLASMTAVEPLSVLDIEFIGYHETEIENLGTTTPGSRN